MVDTIDGVNLVLYHIASGHAFFSGAALILAAVALSAATSNRAARFVRTISSLLGAMLIIASATPLPAVLYGLAGLALLTWLALDRPARPTRRWQVALRAFLVGSCLLAVAWEIPWHLTPHVPFPAGAALYVVGDSVSAGERDGEYTWPQRLRDARRIEIRDFSHVGATARTAMKQTERIDGPGLVLVEIGGNDVLGPNGGTPASQFAADLDALLQRLTGDGHTVAMLELPLPPFGNAYGAAQRRLAVKYGAVLIPKRHFLRVLTTEGATTDSIHLSSRGHELMAEAVSSFLR